MKNDWSFLWVDKTIRKECFECEQAFVWRGVLCDETKTAAREPDKYRFDGRFDGIKGMELTDARVR